MGGKPRPLYREIDDGEIARLAETSEHPGVRATTTVARWSVETSRPSCFSRSTTRLPSTATTAPSRRSTVCMPPRDQTDWPRVTWVAAAGGYRVITDSINADLRSGRSLVV
jgi:hypothetical protein